MSVRCVRDDCEVCVRDECEVCVRDECEVGVRDECDVGVRNEYKEEISSCWRLARRAAVDMTNGW